MRSTWGSAVCGLALAACAAAPTRGVQPPHALQPRGIQPPRGSQPRGIQEVQWFRGGPYAGASLGISNADGSAGELDEELAERGHTSSSTLDDTDTAWKVWAGYRFERPLALEAGYAELGQVTSTIRVTTGDLQQFLRDVAEVHPFLGSGIFLAGLFSPYDEGPVELDLRAGLWLWETDVESQAAPGGEIDVDDRNVDPLLGLVFLFELTRWLEVRLEYEKYFLDDRDADVVSLGLQGKMLR